MKNRKKCKPMLLIKRYISNLVHTTLSGITFIKYVQYRNIEKPNNIKVFGNNKTKGPKQDSQNPLRSSKLEGGEP